MNREAPTTTLSDGGWAAFRRSALPAVVVLVMASVGLAFGLGPVWRYVTDCVTALAVILMLWEALRQRQRTAAQTAEQIGELLKVLLCVKADLSSAELKTIEAELQRLQLDLLSRATLRR